MSHPRLKPGIIGSILACGGSFLPRASNKLGKKLGEKSRGLNYSANAVATCLIWESQPLNFLYNDFFYSACTVCQHVLSWEGGGANPASRRSWEGGPTHTHPHPAPSRHKLSLLPHQTPGCVAHPLQSTRSAPRTCLPVISTLSRADAQDCTHAWQTISTPTQEHTLHCACASHMMIVMVFKFHRWPLMGPHDMRSTGIDPENESGLCEP